MDPPQVLVKNTFLEVTNSSDEVDALPRAFSDQSHARTKHEYVVGATAPTFAGIPEETSELVESRSGSSVGLDADELKTLRTISRPEVMYYPYSSEILPPPPSLSYTFVPSSLGEIGDHKWHNGSTTMGKLTSDGKSFTKLEYGGRLSMVTESEVRHSGTHRYMVYVESGPVSVADGFGYVFSDSLPCKRNIQKIDSIFISKKGKIGSRVHNEMEILNVESIGMIDTGSIVELVVDLDRLQVTFSIYHPPRGIDAETLSILVRNEHSISTWLVGRSSCISIADLVTRTETGRNGYFCAVLKNISTQVRFL